VFTSSTHIPKEVKQPGKEVSFDALVPAEMAVKAAETGVKKTALDNLRMFLLAILAGSFIAMGAIFATTVSAPLHRMQRVKGAAGGTRSRRLRTSTNCRPG